MTTAGAAVPEGTRLVHIGPHKTGSTAIQVALHTARDRLAEHGVAYVTTGGYRPRKAGWALGIRGRPNGSPRPPIRHWRRLVAAGAGGGRGRGCGGQGGFRPAPPPPNPPPGE